MSYRGVLDETGFVTLNGAGAGTVKLGPISARETWHPENASVKANDNPTNEAQCQIFVGETATQDNFRDLTFTGSSGDATGKVSGELKLGRFIYAVWSGGDPGVRAQLIVTGTKDV